MGAHIMRPIKRGLMKTTVEISDALLRQARELAAREGITLRTLVERGLHRVLSDTSAASRSSCAARASTARGGRRNLATLCGTPSAT